MKKLILLLIVFVSSSVFSQINIDDNILGTWASEQTPVELKVVKVKNDLEFIQHNTTTKSTPRRNSVATIARCHKYNNIHKTNELVFRHDLLFKRRTHFGG